MTSGPAARVRPRTSARVAAVQALFQIEQASTAAETVIDEFVRHRLGSPLVGSAGFEDGRTPEADVPLFTRIVRCATAQAETVDGAISAALVEDWPFARIDAVLRALLRAAAAELWMAKGAPARVVINEYLDVAHGFFTGDEPRMANGVLDRIARILRPQEFAASPPPDA
jgi:N utilization substance protein B